MHADAVAAAAIGDEAVAGRCDHFLLEGGTEARADGIGTLAFDVDGGARIEFSADTNGKRGDDRDNDRGKNKSWCFQDPSRLPNSGGLRNWPAGDREQGRDYAAATAMPSCSQVLAMSETVARCMSRGKRKSS